MIHARHAGRLGYVDLGALIERGIIDRIYDPKMIGAAA
jgi:hypothetical protein